MESAAARAQRHRRLALYGAVSLVSAGGLCVFASTVSCSRIGLSYSSSRRQSDCWRVAALCCETDDNLVGLAVELTAHPLMQGYALDLLSLLLLHGLNASSSYRCRDEGSPLLGWSLTHWPCVQSPIEIWPSIEVFSHCLPHFRTMRTWL
jgi:hypothetical protein